MRWCARRGSRLRRSRPWSSVSARIPERRARRFRAGRSRANLTGRTAVVVDNGVATGSTARTFRKAAETLRGRLARTSRTGPCNGPEALCPVSGTFATRGRVPTSLPVGPLQQDSKSMFHRHRGTRAADQPRPASDAPVQRELADSPAPSRACCCPARPAVKVVMPPAPGRPHPVDLWLCGHHHRASRQALAAAGARVYDPTLPAAEASPAGTMTAAPPAR